MNAVNSIDELLGIPASGQPAPRGSNELGQADFLELMVALLEAGPLPPSRRHPLGGLTMFPSSTRSGMIRSAESRTGSIEIFGCRYS